MCLSDDKPSHKFSFSRKERLKKRNDIQELFTDSSSFYEYPFRIRYKKVASESKVLFSVPKRNFKKAVDRNFLKRRSKEAYRLHKLILEKSRYSSYNIAFIYTSKKLHDFDFIEKKVILVLKHFLKNEL